MVHLLTAIRTGVDQGLEAAGRTIRTVLIPAAMFLRQLGREQKHFTQQRLVPVAAIGKGGDMLARHHQQVHRRSRIDIVKNHNILVFKYFF